MNGAGRWESKARLRELLLHVLDGLPDVSIRNERTIPLFTPLTPRAMLWIDEQVEPDALWFGDALVVECRYARDLAEGMKRDGLKLEYKN